jgi:hypothetical protein
MAWDLSRTPSSGLRVQCCGDAHLLNFGLYASLDRRMVFDLNDFDETLPAPFEWDLKRLVASVSVAARDNGCDATQSYAAALAAAARYRSRMAELAAMPFLDVWYSRTDADSKGRDDTSALIRHGPVLLACRRRAGVSASSRLHRCWFSSA